MFRDFSSSAQNDTIAKMTKLMGQNTSGIMPMNGLMLLDFGPWVEKLGIGQYVRAPGKFNFELEIKNTAAKIKMNTVYNTVQLADSMIGNRLKTAREALKDISDYTKEISGFISPSGISMNPFLTMLQLGQYLKSFDAFVEDQKTYHYFHCVDGKWEVDKAKVLNDLQKEFEKMPPDGLLDLVQALGILMPRITITDSEDKTVKTAALFEKKIQDSLLQLFGHEESFRKTLFGSNTVASYLLRLTDGDSVLQFLTGQKITKQELNGPAYDFDFPSNWEKALEKNHPNLRESDKKTKYWDAKNKKWIDEKDAPKYYERQFTLLEYKNSGKAEATWFEYKNDDFLGGNLDVKVGDAEAHADVSAGLYVLNNNGDRVFSPGVSAEVGVSATAFNAKYDVQIVGDEMLGLNADAEVTVLQASAKAGADFNLMGRDKNGNYGFNPQANVHAGAEAILAKAEASGGINVLGGEIGVKGSVQFGVGAKADFGIKDGVVKCELGVSLGLGFDVGFEVDVGGMVDTARSWLKDTFGW